MRAHGCDAPAGLRSLTELHENLDLHGYIQLRMLCGHTGRSPSIYCNVEGYSTSEFEREGSAEATFPRQERAVANEAEQATMRARRRRSRRSQCR